MKKMKNNIKKSVSLILTVLMTAVMGAAALAEDTIGSFDGTTMSKDETLTYTVTHEADYTDLSGVVLSWSVPVVKYNKETATVWNTATLKWEQKVTETTTNNTATFTLVNRSSEAVIADVAFALEDSLKKTGDETNDAAEVGFDKHDVKLNTVVGTDASRTVASDAETLLTTDAENGGCKTVVTATVTLTDAARLTDGSAKLGTYTVSIRDTVHTVTVTYLKNAADEDYTVETVIVDDNTAISVNANVLKIGTNEYTTAAATDDETAFSGWYSAPLQLLDVNTVTADLNITAAYWIS